MSGSQRRSVFGLDRGLSLAFGAFVGMLAIGPVQAQCPPAETAKLLAPDGAAGDTFAQAVAVDGNTAVIGSPNDDTPAGANAGSVSVFVRSGGVWSFQAQLLAPDGAANDTYGFAVAVSGDTILVGAHNHSLPGRPEAGVVYVYVRAGRGGGVWSLQATLTSSDGAAGDEFGRAVAIHGNTAVVGAPEKDTALGEDIGSAYVFVRTGGTWSQQAVLPDAEPNEYGFYGTAVSVSGDTAVVADRGEISVGAAHVFVRSGTAWARQTRLFASDGASGDWFGHAVAIDGDTVIVGSRNDDTPAGVDSGSAYIFERSGSAWTQRAHLRAPDGAAADFFGVSVALSGQTAVVGAFFDDAPGRSNAGSAHLFRRGTAAQWTDHVKLTASDAATDDYFGAAVGLSGSTVLIGALAEDNANGLTAGSAYVFSAGGCPVDVDCNGSLTPADVATFVARWSQSVNDGTLAGDFDGSGTVTPADVATFVGAWFAALSTSC